jgi:hypothetical protein
MEFALHLPINPLSFGQVSTALLREVYKRGLEPAIFTIGNIDLNTQRLEQPFVDWLNRCVSKAISTHKRNVPVIKLWHLNGGLESVSDKQILFTFYELDSPTREEINIIKNNSQVVVSSNYSVKTFHDFGASNVSFAPLGFDKDNFFVKPKRHFEDGRITFNLLGKLEKRKNHLKVLQAWVKKYGNNPKFFLTCAIFNPFLKIEDQDMLLKQALGNRKPFNVEFLKMMPTNEMYNDFLNSGDITIAMSGGEGWGLGEFHSVALGKYCVGLNAHAHKDWMNDKNTVLVNPSGKTEAYDGAFFHKGHPFNQGNIYTFDDEEFIAGCEKAVELFKINPVNQEGRKLQDFSYSATLDKLLSFV